MTKKVIVHKGLTVKDPDRDVYDKDYIGLEWDLPDEVDEAAIATIMARMRALIRQELGTPAAAAKQTPEFNPEELMKHPWKGRKKSEGGHEKGSLGWGWDKKENFPSEVIKVLEKGPLTIGDYTFTLDGNLVSTKKKK